MTVTTIPSAGITDATIDTADIKDNAVTAAKASGLGITVADHWRITSDFTGDATPLSANWERVDTAGQGYIGSGGMAVSSGIWTFPSTGIYFVEFNSQHSWTSTSFYNTANIKITTDNGSFTTVAEGDSSQTMGADSGTWYTVSRVYTMVDVTDTSNVKIQFNIDVNFASVTTRGSSSVNLTHATFTRVGDT